MAKFGSVAWQEEMRKRILKKFVQGRKLDVSEQVFIQIQLERNKKLRKVM